MLGKIVRRIGTGKRLGRFLIACMVLGFAALIVAGIGAAWLTSRNQEHTRWVNHTYEVEIAIAEAGLLIEQGETSRRGYLLTRQQSYLETYDKVAAKLPVAIARVRGLTQDNAAQQANIVRLEAQIAELKARRDRTIALARTGQLALAFTEFDGEANARRMIRLRELGIAMRDREKQLLKVRDAEQQDNVRLFYLILAAAGVILLLVALASVATILRYTRDLAASRDTLRDFADSLEELVSERTADLSRANEEIQRFAYIVSHDLRSPLVNVMGFTAELDAATASITDLIDRAEAEAPHIVTEDARLAAREDLPEAIGFIRTSTQKMDRLINAILKLSREGRRVIAPAPVDMVALVETIGRSLKHMMDDRDATLTTEGELPEIVTDRLAIEQIFSNLIENAVKYLQPGRPGRIVVRAQRHGARVTFEVEDNGRGIGPTDHQRVFDLFRRAGNQDQPGEGIGLAHVRALAYRLGGVIDVSSELGKGATFRLTLPATLSEIEGKI
ncbi:sensor histidine kinase [Sphingomonas endolithica]|uniref:sensor histidine kinase n=1 Tax=Sphingomonas endolithica TaxID=2972485 RepID=UPI0021AF9DEA|nr:sensor histidine kinase [Sphingomonas sp. ZFBP2030]